MLKSWDSAKDCLSLSWTSCCEAPDCSCVPSLFFFEKCFQKSPFPHNLAIEKNIRILLVGTNKNCGNTQFRAKKNASGNSEKWHVTLLLVSGNRVAEYCRAQWPSSHPEEVSSHQGGAVPAERPFQRSYIFSMKCNSVLVGAWPFGSVAITWRSTAACWDELSNIQTSRRKGAVP